MAATAGRSGSATFHRSFTLSITKALGDQLATDLATLARAPLSDASIGQLLERPGVYQLYLHDDFVYVGKADKSLPVRLRQHLKKISGRRGIVPSDMTFSCLYVAEDFSALAPEQLLINHHKDLGEIPWNNNGFGNRDPGRQRDHTVLKPNHFDVLYPIDLARPAEGLTAGETNVLDLLEALKASLPYNIRYAKSGDLRSANLVIPDVQLSVDDLLKRISEAASSGWQITALGGYIVMYEEGPAEYASASRYYRGGQAIDSVPLSASEDETAVDSGSPARGAP
ncbi:GIY-YIG nuclease family protein [Streptomyces diacarni]|uniref:GIY-YIG nuclease family protein n=1 Tax=Streptomyces diacarni TaxID=2800381 RepID=A0A367F004_9ACTN|nr:GIY-YIG nuclease family protein [Streptomyces diacarni]RCG23663.1 GIY-YIG nuclease family protein [Streptomyces diacarni]